MFSLIQLKFIKKFLVVFVLICFSVALQAQPFSVSIFTNSFPLAEKLFLDIKQEGSFVTIDSFLSEGSPTELFKSIQFKEAAFLQIRNAEHTVYRTFYADAAVTVFYDSITQSVTIDGSAATALSDSFYARFSAEEIQLITRYKSFKLGQTNAIENSLFTMKKETDQSLMDAILLAYKNFILQHPYSYFSLDLIAYCTNKIPIQELFKLLQSLKPNIKKHSFAKWQFVQLQQQISKGEPQIVLPFKIVDARKQSFSNDDLQQGIFVIDFWGTWCGPCIAAMPKLVKLAKKFDGRVQFISYAMEINSNNLSFEAAEKKYGIYWKSYFENRKSPTGIADMFKIEGFPTYILIKDGVILKKSLSARGLPQIESMIERLLEQEIKNN